MQTPGAGSHCALSATTLLLCWCRLDDLPVRLNMRPTKSATHCHIKHTQPLPTACHVLLWQTTLLLCCLDDQINGTVRLSMHPQPCRLSPATHMLLHLPTAQCPPHAAAAVHHAAVLPGHTASFPLHASLTPVKPCTGCLYPLPTVCHVLLQQVQVLLCCRNDHPVKVCMRGHLADWLQVKVHH